MKLDKQFYRETFSAVEMSHEMKEKLMLIPNNASNTNKDSRKKLAVLLVASLIIVCSAISVFAGVNVFNLYTKKHGKYSESLVLDKSEKNNYNKVLSLSKKENVIKPQFVKLVVGNLPQGFTKSTNTENILKLDYNGKNGITFDIIDVSDYDQITINHQSVVDSQLTTLNENSVYYIEKQNLVSEDVFSKDIYMYNEEFDYLIHGYIGYTVPKNVAYEIFENLALVECEEWESHSTSKWIEPVDEDNVYYESEGDYYEPEINNYIQVGESSRVTYDTDSQIEVTVDSIKISDDLSMMDDDFKSKYLDKNGKIKPLEVKCYGGGDGINTLPELMETKYIDMVYIYETVTYKNTSDKDIKNFIVYHNIVSPPGDIYVEYKVFDSLREKYNDISYDNEYIYKIGEWAYDDFSKQGTNSPNSIDIPANDETTVNIGFFVAKETLNEDLWIEVDNGYTINNGFAVKGTVLVDIQQ